ncbi:hypothetical protein [Xanthomonas hortorum]|uniref:hypothetical protein n=1 Tax=Xanthomonas hortorum TaxID=56454 RepID=UPI0011129467|nr:hypothetical protein [Xanthomonas hortorum]
MRAYTCVDGCREVAGGGGGGGGGAGPADDILWRRSKLGLRIDAAGRQRLEDYLQTQSVQQVDVVPA